MKRPLARWLARRDRGPVMHRLILAVLPRAIAHRFDAAAADDLDATLELSIRHESRSAGFALAITDARCTVRRGSPAHAHARASIGADDLILLAAGAATWPQLLSSGRFGLTGDPFLALRFATLFRLPVVLEAAESTPGLASSDAAQFTPSEKSELGS